MLPFIGKPKQDEDVMNRQDTALASRKTNIRPRGSRRGTTSAERRKGAEVITEDQRRQLHRHLFPMLKDPEEAEDVVQEALLRLHRQQERLREPGASLAWLYT